MASILQKTRIRISLAFLALICDISLTFGDGGNLYQILLIPTEKPKSVSIDVKTNENTYRLDIDNLTIQLLRTAEILHQLGQQPSKLGNENTVLFVARYPSQRKNPKGRCGAGYEDFLLLFGFDKKQFRLRDKLLLQSCLQALSLASDGEDDPTHLVKIESNNPLRIKATWLAHPKYGNSDITIAIRDQQWPTLVVSDMTKIQGLTAQ